MTTELLPLLYERALLIRRAEEAVVEQYAEQNRALANKETLVHAIKCPTHLSIGQEAAAAALSLTLRPEDVLVSTHRCHGHYLGKGGDLRAMMAELFGKVTGCCLGKGGSMHLVDPSVGMFGSSAIVGGSIPMAVGGALSFQLRNLPLVSIACLGDGAVEQGVFSEALNFAALRRLPMIFLVENNFYATLSHIESRQSSGIVERAQPFGIWSRSVEGDTLEGVHDALREGVSHARGGGGPALLEVRAYRWMSHVGTEVDTGRMRRTQEELDGWRERCPISRAERVLAAREGGVKLVADIRDRVSRMVEDALQFAKQSPEPAIDQMFDGLGAQRQS